MEIILLHKEMNIKVISNTDQILLQETGNVMKINEEIEVIVLKVKEIFKIILIEIEMK